MQNRQENPSSFNDPDISSFLKNRVGSADSKASGYNKKQHTDNQQVSAQEEKSQQKQQILHQHQLQQSDHEESIAVDSLPPANPIINRSIKPDSEINFKLMEHKASSHLASEKGNTILGSKPKLHANILKKNQLQLSSKIKSRQEAIDDDTDEMSLWNGYDPSTLVFQKCENQSINQINRKKYYASIFSPLILKNRQFQMKVKIPPYLGMISGVEKQKTLFFDSKFQSGNLFAVYQTSFDSYDLILQNDQNTTGCTQWFFFGVQNHCLKNLTVRFNIVNLYKSSSLFGEGMKPMVNSLKSNKGWKRKGQNVCYCSNDLKREGSSKYYNSLSFSYDFTKDNDTVYFAHSPPYTYADLTDFLKSLDSSHSMSGKCQVKSLGLTPLKNSLPIVKFESDSGKSIKKKSIIIMARQHPGEVQGSFAVQQILSQLLSKKSSEIQFLLWRFNVYVIPMVNVDGVVLGNYRSNAMGMDLNRNWDGQLRSKYPEITFIKQEIRKIMSKFPVELILDLHGHSRKMNSFFYGNPFGPNPQLLPMVSSKNSDFVKFEECTFSLERKAKSKTARSVLGHMIKETGNVYTYQMSFYGGTKNGKTISFSEDSYKQLGKQLLSSVYKVMVEIYKEEKSLRESLYLKEMRKEITKIENSTDKTQQKQASDSDSEAVEEIQDSNCQLKAQVESKIQKLSSSNGNQLIKDNGESLCESENLGRILYPKQPFTTDRSSQLIYQRQQEKKHSTVDAKMMSRNSSLMNYKSSHPYDNFNYDETLEDKVRKHKKYADKLRIFGENYLTPLKDYQYEEDAEDQKEFQTLKLQSLARSRNSSVINYEKNRISKSINFNSYSSMGKHSSKIKQAEMSRDSLKAFQEQKSVTSVYGSKDAEISEIVKINRLDYKRIDRDLNEKVKKKLKKGMGNQANIAHYKDHPKNKVKSTQIGVFKLPAILNHSKS